MVGPTNSQLKHEVISVEEMRFILSGMDYIYVGLRMDLLLYVTQFLCNRYNEGPGLKFKCSVMITIFYLGMYIYFTWGTRGSHSPGQ